MKAIAQVSHARLASLTDPDPSAAALASEHGVPWFPTLEAMLAAPRPDAIILATPNHLHVPQGLACIEARIPTLIEKPIASDTASALELVSASERSGVPILIGHHRRHSPLIAAAKARLNAGEIGEIVAVNALCWLYKPGEYFDADWRRRSGAGPVFINLVHDIDLLRHLCGEITSVQALESHATRGFETEDTAAILLRFTNGALGTVTVSDTIVAPWSWELTAGENPAYPETGQTCYHIGGTLGSLEVPAGHTWKNKDKRGWWEPIARQTHSVPAANPLVRQINHLCGVAKGTEQPLVTAREGLNTLRVIEAIKTAAHTGKTVSIDTGN